MSVPKVAIIISHPIQHFCPLYASWSKIFGIKFKVFFGTSLGATSYFDRDFGKMLKWDSLYLNDFDHEFLSNNDLSELENENLIKILEENLMKFAPDAVVIYGYAEKIQRKALSWADKNNCKILFFSDSELRHKREWFKKIMKQFYLPRYYKKVDAFLTIGDANEEYYRYYGVSDKKFFRTPYPIDISCYEDAYGNKNKLNKIVRKKYNIPSDNIICTVVGKLVQWKSQDHLIKAIKNLDNELSNITIFIIGSGEKENEWKKIAEKVRTNRIIFTGFIDSHKLPGFYAATDIYIHPAFIEPHSVAISEAIFMGCPVIVSSYCGSYGSNDDVQEGKNGFVYAYSNVNQLSGLIKVLANDQKLRISFGKHSRNVAVKFQKLAHFGGIKSALQAIELL